MNTFKTQEELHRFLLDGGVIQYTESNDLFLYQNGFIVNRYTGKKCAYLFTKPEDWRPYVKKEWYEQIPDGGVWCIGVWRIYEAYSTICLIKEYKDGYFFGENGKPMSYFLNEIKPITKEFYEEMGKHIYEH